MSLAGEPKFQPRVISLRVPPGTSYDLALLRQAVPGPESELIRTALRLGIAKLLQLAEVESQFYPQLFETTDAEITLLESEFVKAVKHAGL